MSKDTSNNSQDDTKDEVDSGTDYSSTNEDNGVKIPEEFQKSVDSIVGECDSMHCLDYISSCVSEKRSELMKAESSDEPDSFSTEGMPH